METSRQLAVERRATQVQMALYMPESAVIQPQYTDLLRLMRKVVAYRELLLQYSKVVKQLQEDLLRERIAASYARTLAKTEVTSNYNNCLETQNLLLQSKLYALEKENRQLYSLCNSGDVERLLSYATELTQLVASTFAVQTDGLKDQLVKLSQEHAFLRDIEQKNDLQAFSMLPPSVKHNEKRIADSSETSLLKYTISTQSKRIAELERENRQHKEKLNFASYQLQRYSRDFYNLGYLKYELDAERVRGEALQMQLSQAEEYAREAERAHDAVVASMVHEFAQCLSGGGEAAELCRYYADLYYVRDIACD